jgi:hypothetical protein
MLRIAPECARNDGVWRAMESIGGGVLDTPLAPVIGLAEGETRWRGMTAGTIRTQNIFLATESFCGPRTSTGRDAMIPRRKTSRGENDETDLDQV